MKNCKTEAKAKTRSILLLLLCAIIAFALTGCGSKETKANEYGDPVAGQEYYRFDAEAFHQDCEKLDELAAGDDSEKIISQYDELYGQYEQAEALYAVIYVKYAIDITNEKYSSERLDAYSTIVDCDDELCAICRKITEGPCAEDFRKHVGEKPFKYFSEYDALTDEDKKLIRQEEELVDNYYEELDAVEDDEEITDEEANETLGEIYLKLIKIRDTFAKSKGFDNYAAYADEKEYMRDYTEKELEGLHKQIKEVAKDYFNSVYMSYINDNDYNGSVMTTKKMLKNLGEYGKKIDPMVGDSFEELSQEKLYSIGSDSKRQEGAFTTYIETTKKPFICMTMEGERDFLVLSHEFGHFVEFRNDGQKQDRANLLTTGQNMDLAEIASNGLQALYMKYFDEIYGKNADWARKRAMQDLMSNVVDGCIQDEFQRAVYENPDMTLEEINETFGEVYRQYDPWITDSTVEDASYYWVYVPHNFEVPMYYISYAVSGIAAMQLWEISNEDYGRAVEIWKKFVEEGAFDNGYMDVVEKCGLDLFTDGNAVKSTFEKGGKLLKQGNN